MLHVGPRFAVPFRWQHNISLEPSETAPLPQPLEIRVDGIDLTSDNSYAQSGHGFRLRARLQLQEWNT